MQPARSLGLGIALIAMGALVACSGGSGSSSDDQYGSLSVALMDAPVSDVTEIWVEISQLNLKPQGDGPAIEFPLVSPLQVDMLTLDEHNAATLLNAESVPAGAYNWLELVMNAEFDGNLDSYVVTSVGGQEELRVPSGSVRLVSGFTVTANNETNFLIDWDMRLGLVRPPGQTGYMLRPAFRIIDMTEFGTLSGMVETTIITDDAACTDDDADLNVGNVVYIFQGPGATPDDIDGIDANPVATASVTQGVAGFYTYDTILSPGDYTVTFTCQGGNDDPEADDVISFLPEVDVSIVADGAEVVDF